MIHGKQFTLRIAFRCVLHRCESQEIRCQKLFIFLYNFRQVDMVCYKVWQPIPRYKLPKDNLVHKR